RPEALDTLQLAEIEVLDLRGERAKALEEFDVPPVLLGFGVLAVDDRDLAGLGQAVGSALHDRLVDPLLEDLVADIVGAIDIEALLVEAKPDRERGVLDEDQVRRL